MEHEPDVIGRFYDTRGWQQEWTAENTGVESRLSGKNLGMIGHFFGLVRKKIARSAILKCGVIRQNVKT